MFKNLFKIKNLKFKIRRLSKRAVITLITIILVILPTIIFILQNAKSVQAVWYNDDWGFRKSIGVTNNTSAETNKFISVTISNTNTLVTNSQLQSDCGDMRFTTQNGEILPFYIASGCNSSSTVVHINFNTFPAGAQTVYFYYGNPSVSNGFNAADFSSEATSYTIGSTGSAENAPSPLVYWKFDEGTGTTAKDSTTNANNGTLGGTTIPTWQTEDQCISGKCLYFDGATSKVTGSKIALGVQSVSVWVKPNTLSATTPLIDLDGGTHKITVNASGVVTATGFTSPTIYVNGLSGGTVSVNKWNLVEVTTGTGFNTTSSFTIATDGTNYTKGFFDETKLYNYARSSAQILADYNSRANNEGASAVFGTSNNNNFNALNNGLVGYWKMDETSGNAADSSGNAVTLTNNNTTAYSTGMFGNAGSFTAASSNYFSTATAINSVKTVAFWVNPTASTDEYINLTSGAYITSSSGTVSATGFTSPSIYVNGVLNGTITANVWNHVVVTTGTAINANAFEVGRANGSYVNGKIDETRLYNRALSSAEVSTLYNFAPGPVAYYNFDENTGSTVNDKSGNGNTGTWNGSGSPHWKAGKNNSAGNFDGSTDYVNISDNDSLSPLNITVTAWIYPAAFCGGNCQATILGKDYTEYEISIANGSGICPSNNVLLVYIGGVSNILCGTKILSLNNWYHITFTYDGANIKTYINGVLDATKSNTNGIPNGTNPFRIGMRASSVSWPYKGGLIDDVKIYNYARTQQQIVEDMTNGSDVGGSGYTSANSSTGGSIAKPVGYWKFDEGYGTTANNVGSGGSALNGTLTNMSSPATSTSGWTQAGKVGKGLVFDGINDYVSTSSNIVGGKSAITLSTWVKPTSVTGGGAVTRILSNYYTILGYNSSGVPSFSIQFSVNSSSICTYSGITLSTGNWYHLVGVFNGAGSDNSERSKVYVNGLPLTLISCDATVPASIYNSGTNFGIGSDSGLAPSPTYPYANATIDEVKIYPYALTADQVKLDMNQGAAQVVGAISDNSSYQKQAANQEYCIPGDSTSCAAPVGRWDFDEGTGSSVNDSSGNANTGTWNGTGNHWKVGRVNKSGNFNGTDDYVSSPLSGTSLTNTTISLWFNPTSNSGTKGIFQWASELTATTPFILLQNDNGILKYYVDGNYREISQSLSPGNWYHAVITLNNSTTWKFYLNGTLLSTYTGGITYQANATSVYFGNGYNGYFSGKIDQVRIFNYARTAAQVAWDYNKGAPVGWWKIDECQGTVANDSSGNGNSGTITIGASGTQTTAGTCTDGSSTSAWNNGKTGKKNYSLNFDGTDDYVSISNTLTLNSSYTLSAWVNAKSLSASTSNDILTFKNGSNHGILMETGDGSSNKVRFLHRMPVGVSGGDSFYSNTILNASNWYYITEVRDINTNKMYIYINGILDNSITITNSDFGATALTLSMGYLGATSSRFWNGQIDDVRIYNYALTPTQIKTLFNEGAYRVGPVTGAP